MQTHLHPLDLPQNIIQLLLICSSFNKHEGRKYYLNNQHKPYTSGLTIHHVLKFNPNIHSGAHMPNSNYNNPCSILKGTINWRCAHALERVCEVIDVGGARPHTPESDPEDVGVKFHVLGSRSGKFKFLRVMCRGKSIP